MNFYCPLGKVCVTFGKYPNGRLRVLCSVNDKSWDLSTNVADVSIADDEFIVNTEGKLENLFWYAQGLFETTGRTVNNLGVWRLKYAPKYLLVCDTFHNQMGLSTSFISVYDTKEDAQKYIDRHKKSSNGEGWRIIELEYKKL